MRNVKFICFTYMIDNNSQIQVLLAKVAASNMFVSIVTTKGYLNIYNYFFQSHLSRVTLSNSFFITGRENIRPLHPPRCEAALSKYTATLSRDLALAFSYPVRVGAAHRSFMP